MQDTSMRKYFLFQRQVTHEGHRSWFEKMCNSDQEKIYAITIDQLHVGNLGLKNIDLPGHRAETWIYIGDSSVRGKGIASKAYLVLFDLLRMERRIKYLYCHIASFNLSSIRLYQQLGFEQDLSFVQLQKWEEQEYQLLRFNKKM